ncbi:MAG: rhodanese-like domain-containing protein, partial [Microbacterium sp.]
SAPPAGRAAVRLADLYPADSVGDLPSCAQVGVLGPLCVQVGAILATEVVKLVTGVGEPLLGRVVVIDALRGRTDEVPLRPAEVAGAGAGGAAAAGVPADATPSPDPVPHIDLGAALAAQAGGATLLDVREPHETATGVLPGAIEVPLGRLLADPALAGPGPVVVVCKVGVRAERAARALQSAGIAASVLAGGMDAWAPGLRERAPA